PPGARRSNTRPEGQSHLMCCSSSLRSPSPFQRHAPYARTPVESTPTEEPAAPRDKARRKRPVPRRPANFTHREGMFCRGGAGRGAPRGESSTPAGADLNPAVAHPDLEARLRVGRGTVEHAPVAEREARAVPGAHHTVPL